MQVSSKNAKLLPHHFRSSPMHADPSKQQAHPIAMLTNERCRCRLEIEHMKLQTRLRSEEHTSELQSLMRISYAVFCLKKKITTKSRNSRSIIQTYTNKKKNR